jgi:alkyl-hydroperoxide reductase/thiol specific antioxidant family protein
VKVLSHRDRIEAAGGLVLAVAFDEPDRVRAGVLSGIDDPWPVLIDHDRAAYWRWGLRRASRRQLARLDWIRGYARMLLRGDRLSRPGRDVLQLGGDFVIDREGVVVFAHAQSSFDDRPPAGLLVRALEGAR